jgi:hypothetical protein
MWWLLTAGGPSWHPAVMHTLFLHSRRSLCAGILQHCILVWQQDCNRRCSVSALITDVKDALALCLTHWIGSCPLASESLHVLHSLCCRRSSITKCTGSTSIQVLCELSLSCCKGSEHHSSSKASRALPEKLRHVTPALTPAHMPWRITATLLFPDSFPAGGCPMLKLQPFWI